MLKIFNSNIPEHPPNSNKAKQHQPLRGLDSLAVALFVHGCAIIAQKSQLQVCRCWQRYGLLGH
jgi:hypothetical protein